MSNETQTTIEVQAKPVATIPVPRPVTNLTDFGSLVPLSEEIVQMIAPARALKVTDPASCKSAVDAGKQIATLRKKFEEKRKELVKPLNDTVDETNAYVKSLVAPLLVTEEHLKGEVKLFQAKIAAEQAAERQRLADLKAEADRKAREAAASLEGPSADPVAFAQAHLQNVQLQAQIDRETKVLDQTKLKGARKVWKFEVLDPAIVPREFLMVDEKAIRAAIAEGARTIPGVNIFQDTSISFNSRTSIGEGEEFTLPAPADPVPAPALTQAIKTDQEQLAERAASLFGG